MDDSVFLSKLERYGAARWQPVTFLERGISMAFTTPLLMGARARPLERPSGASTLELIVPNPSGAEGVYVLPWAAMPDLCSPSVHDRQFWSRVADLKFPTPRRMRDVARAIAVEGFAGRDAARAAAQALETARQSRLATHYFLLLRLIKQAETAAVDGTPPERESPERLVDRARKVLAERLAAAVGGPEAAYRTVEEVAELLEPVGLPGDPTRAPLPQLVRDLDELDARLSELAESPDEVQSLCAGILQQSIRPTLSMARATLAEAQTMADDMTLLLRRWAGNPQAVRTTTGRPDWLLDGWDLILGLWRDSGAAALPDMAGLCPVVPREAEGWAGCPPDWETAGLTSGPRRNVQANRDWRTGRMLELQRRNERVKALAA
ncbi:hypothetical protein LPC08_16190 [Roseomonas sp. OT10]|uniref:hypothetical protein n=1 Tax=Roseomonas cutis TaxID=2897332 RepID=UPI001E4721F1|nr:hypothetical protein [Roseomonas sp. OT10]UFN47547.1 hypothetical protein LPC08_16190 [Roseomonas sp. OT10]